MCPAYFLKWLQNGAVTIYIPHADYEMVGSLVCALTIALDTSEVELQLVVKQLSLWCDLDVDALVDY